MDAIAEITHISRNQFESEVLARYEPVVLRGVVHDWPAVQAARTSDAALSAFLLRFANDAAVDAVMVPPKHSGRLAYAEDLRGFTFLRNQVTLPQVLEMLARYARFADSPALAMQSAPASICAPRWAEHHVMPLLDAAVTPRLWLGNAIITPTHFDESANIACVVAGQRRFTLFPPDEIGNLYVGAIGQGPTGTPISLVDLDAPDFERYPRFTHALARARQATLDPGDAIYIPPLWWHHVASTQPLNLLVNYWWSTSELAAPSGMDALLHALLALRACPAPQRQAWQAIFAHWIFHADEDTAAHLPAYAQGVHGPMTAALAEQIRVLLREKLK
ncbi:MAG: cupin-like domain-containing protein [Burkholderiaceae bacterium]